MVWTNNDKTYVLYLNNRGRPEDNRCLFSYHSAVSWGCLCASERSAASIASASAWAWVPPVISIANVTMQLWSFISTICANHRTKVGRLWSKAYAHCRYSWDGVFLVYLVYVIKVHISVWWCSLNNWSLSLEFMWKPLNKSRPVEESAELIWTYAHWRYRSDVFFCS